MLMIETHELTKRFGERTAVEALTFEVEEGEVLGLLGPNGAGKTTLFRAISGLKDYRGRILLFGEELPSKPAAIVGKGIIHCPEGRHLFPFMSVYDNLMLGAYRRNRDKTLQEDLEMVYTLFPVLRERRKQLARTLSGGEQQMLAIGRALMGRPRLLLLDEPTLGLAPIIRQAISTVLERINAEGMTILLAEQNAVFALELSDRLYLLEVGRIVKEGDATEFRRDEHIRRVYLGR